jgi:copper homeostasis protein (lipoprotein)
MKRRGTGPGASTVSDAIILQPASRPDGRREVVDGLMSDPFHARAVRVSFASFPVLAVLALTLRCAPAFAASDAAKVPVAGSTLGALPATYTGLLPCADCVGIRVQLNLLPGAAYMQRMTYLRDGRDDGYYDLGAWSLSGDGTLTLHGGREGDARWAVKNARTLRKLDRRGRPIDSSLPYELTRSAGVEPMEPRVRLSGMFRYMADAARFRDCGSGLQWPVEMSGDYRTLERVYLARRTAPGAELLVSLQVRIAQRPKMDSAGAAPVLVVEKFVDAMPGGKCEERAQLAGLENSRWRPVRIGDRYVTVSAQRGEPWIVLEPGTRRVTGSGGCNRISGSYETGSGTLRFSPMISTKMACPSMDTETAFLRALNGTRRFRIQGRILELMGNDGKTLVRLEERNLK